MYVKARDWMGADPILDIRYDTATCDHGRPFDKA